MEFAIQLQVDHYTKLVECRLGMYSLWLNLNLHILRSRISSTSVWHFASIFQPDPGVINCFIVVNIDLFKHACNKCQPDFVRETALVERSSVRTPLYMMIHMIGPRTDPCGTARVVRHGFNRPSDSDGRLHRSFSIKRLAFIPPYLGTANLVKDASTFLYSGSSSIKFATRLTASVVNFPFRNPS